MRQSAVPKLSSFAPVLISGNADDAGDLEMNQCPHFTFCFVAPALLFALAAACGSSSSDGGRDRSNRPSDSAPISPIAVSEGEDDAPSSVCDAAASQQFDTDFMRPYEIAPEVAANVDGLLAQMTHAEKFSQMMGVSGVDRNWQDLYRHDDVEVPGVGIVRGYWYRDAGRGVNLDSRQNNRPNDNNNFSTAFPTPSLRGASWDLDLEKRVGAAIGDETAASYNNVLLAPTMNIVRHPYWGRTQETYGEDSYHLGRMATAFTVGAQEYVVACAKHFLGNNIEDRRSTQNATMTEQTLREVYARHFEMVVQDGAVGCVMASYNLVNGIKATQNEHLLRGILKAPVERGGMGFEGFVVSDWWALPGDQTAPRDAPLAQNVATKAVHAGLDVEMPWTFYYNQTTLTNVDPALIDDAVKRILTQKLRFNTLLTTDPWGAKPPTSTLTEGSITPNETHEALSEEAAIKSAVLVSNGLDGNPVLPLTGATHIAVTGPRQEFSLISSSVPKMCGYHPTEGVQDPLEPVTRACTFNYATDAALGDRGSSRVNADPERSFSPYHGIAAAAGARTVTLATPVDDTLAIAIAPDADVVVVIVGYTPGDEGEEFAIASGGDRSSLDLPEGQNDFVSSVLDLNKPTVIVVESGSIVNLPWLNHANRNQATIWAGYPGQRGGLALGKLIFGEANFSGKMPMTWPTETELPAFKDSETETHMGYFFGYREFDRRRYLEGAPTDVVFPFGHGLSYTTYEYSNLSLPCQSAAKDAVFDVTVDITNTGDVDGDEVAMLFVKPPPKPAGVTGERPWKELKSFARVSVPAGQTVTAQLPLRIRDLRRWEGAESGRWIVDSGEYTILVGKNADDAETSTLVGTVMIEGD